MGPCIHHIILSTSVCLFSVVNNLKIYSYISQDWLGKAAQERLHTDGWTSVRPIIRGCRPGEEPSRNGNWNLAWKLAPRVDCLILCFCAYTIPPMRLLINPPLIPGTTFPDYVSKHLLPAFTNPPFTTALASSSSSVLEHEDEVVGRPESAQ